MKLWSCEIEIFYWIKRFCTRLRFVQNDTVLFCTQELEIWTISVFKRKDFFILIMFLREQSWRNSFALKRWGKWCDDVVMWWCGYVVMRWKSRIRNLRHWVLCKTTAPIDNATLTDTIFFSPTLKGGKLFIVSCEFWVFLYAKIFFILIMYLREQSWRNSFASKRWGKWYGIRGAS